MNVICLWCQSKEATHSLEPAYWELPDGTQAIKIGEVPSVKCPECDIVYIEESLINEIENHFMIINTKNIPRVVTYKELMDQPKQLKKNYFDF